MAKGISLVASVSSQMEQKLRNDCNQWPMVKVVGINTDAEGSVWSVKLLVGKTRNDGEQILERPIHKIILLKES